MLYACFNRNKSSKPPPKSRNAPFGPDSTKRLEDDSLLQDHPTSFQTDFFGQYKGFRLSPISTNEESKPIRAVPPVPSIPTIPNVIIKNPNRAPRASTAPVAMVKPVVHTTNATENHVSIVSNNNIAPALPPLNPGSHARPLISSPILKASTCTAKELISPLKTAPKLPTRPAPDAPITENPRPLSSPIKPAVSIILEEMQQQHNKIKENPSALNRIASFLKPKEDKNKSNAAPQNNVKLNKNIDKTALRSIQISNPIPQTEIAIKASDLPSEPEKNRAVVMRAQSMRGNNITTRPNIQTFGSMRQPHGAKRPTSIPVGSRPKSPPPPTPPVLEMDANVVDKIPGVPGYQEPTKPVTKPVTTVSKTSDYQYDDCLNESPLAKISEEVSPSSGDNIYAVIEETPKSFSSGQSNSNSSESVGLLGEIVSEIQNRNFDSIYSTSTLARKKKEALEMEQKKSLEKVDNAENYVNTSTLYRSPDSLYSNMSNIAQSSASSTASGYIHPSAVNAPAVKPVVDKKISPNNNLSTFKTDKPDISSYKPYHSNLQRNAGPFAASFKATPANATLNPTTTNKVSFKTPPVTNTVNLISKTAPVTATVNSTLKSTPVSTINSIPTTATVNPTIKSTPLTTNSSFKPTPVTSTFNSTPTSVNSILKPTPTNTLHSTFKSAPLTNTVSSTLKSTPLTNIVVPKSTPVTNTTLRSAPVTKTVTIEKSLEPTIKTPITSPTAKKTETSENKVKSPSPVSSPTSKTPKPIGRQVTPVNLRTRKPSPVRNTSNLTSKNTKIPATSNSPDLVISCSTTTNTKSPDVLNSAKVNNKPNGVLPKPTVTPKVAPKTVKSPTERKPVGKSPVAAKHKINSVNSADSKINSVSAKLPTKIQPSTVAALQQKFENKNLTTKTK